MMQGVTEQAVLVGERRSIVGILTTAVGRPKKELPAIIILNTGLIHRVGNNRMFVTMSRSFASAGFPVLRFDFSGVGDSDPRIDRLSPIESCMADIGDAIGWVTSQLGASRVVLVGLCSGADHAVLYCHGDPRIVAVVLMDPSIPATVRHYVYYIGARLLRLRNWASVAAGRSRLLQEWVGVAQRLARKALNRHQIPPHYLPLPSLLEQAYQKAVDRGVRVLAIFSEETTRQTYREQMIDAFPNIRFGPRLRLEFLANSDHTFSRDADRRSLTHLTLQFLESISDHTNRSTASCARLDLQRPARQ